MDRMVCFLSLMYSKNQGNMKMKKTSKILVGVGLAAVTTGLIIYAVRRYRSSQKRTRIANEGYETAHDILYPPKYKRKKVHYGPVLPE
jgi:hypothetical protein